MKIKSQNIKNKIKLVGADGLICPLPKENTRNNLDRIGGNNNRAINIGNC